MTEQQLSQKKLIGNRAASEISTKRSSQKNQLAHHLCSFYDPKPMVDPETGVVVKPPVLAPQDVDLEMAAAEIRSGGPIPEWAVDFKKELEKNPRPQKW